jgi:hypothetical protein
VMQYRWRGFSNFHPLPARPNNHGIAFYGDKATIVLDRSGYEIWNDNDPRQSVEKVDNPRRWRDGLPGNEVDGPWQRTFLDCVKEGRRPPLKLRQSHEATVCCHLANIAYLTGHKVRWDAEQEEIPGDPAAAALLQRPRRSGYELPEV